MKDNIYVLIAIGIAGSMLLCGGLIFFIVSYLKRVKRQQEVLKQAELAYQAGLFTAVIESQETERRKIGREMHDEVGSILSGMRLSMSSRMMHNEGDPATAEHIRSIDKLIGIVRNISHLLSPPELEYSGFHESLETLCDTYSNPQLQISLQDEIPSFITTGQFNTSLSLYRIFQELLTNSVRHGKATQIDIHLRNEGTMLIAAYEDNGCGFLLDESHSDGLGLQNIKSRLLMIHADYKLETAIGKGFKMAIFLAHEHIL